MRNFRNSNDEPERGRDARNGSFQPNRFGLHDEPTRGRLTSMTSYFSRILGGLSGKPADADAGEASQRGDPVSYEGLVIRAAPEPAGNQWRLAGVIIKQGDDGDLERTFTRSDTFATREEAETFAIRKGQQIIDERGSRLFADGGQTGRA